MTPQLRYILRSLRRFENATRIHELMGTFHPDEWDDIEKEYQRSKELLIEKINKYT